MDVQAAQRILRHASHRTTEKRHVRLGIRDAVEAIAQLGTLLSKGGVTPRTAQAAMRHSSLDLTMNVYTDPRLLDVAGALESLPDLPLDEAPQTERQRATGTCDGRPLAPTLARDLVQASTSRPNADTTTTRTNRLDGRNRKAVSPGRVKTKPKFQPFLGSFSR